MRRTADHSPLAANRPTSPAFYPTANFLKRSLETVGIEPESRRLFASYFYVHPLTLNADPYYAGSAWVNQVAMITGKYKGPVNQMAEGLVQERKHVHFKT